MARPSAFKQADATKALKAAVAAGLKPSGYTIGADGAIHVTFGDGPSPLANSFDRLRQGR
jgi:hypothetical protein